MMLCFPCLDYTTLESVMKLPDEMTSAELDAWLEKTQSTFDTYNDCTDEQKRMFDMGALMNKKNDLYVLRTEKRIRDIERTIDTITTDNVKHEKN